MATTMCSRCRFRARVLLAWRPVFKAPGGAMLLSQLSQQHPDHVGRYLDLMRGTEDIGEMVAEAYEVVGEDET